MVPAVFFVFEGMILVVKVQMGSGQGRFLYDDLCCFVLLDRTSLGSAVVVVVDIDADTFALIATVADRVKIVFSETSPPAGNHSRSELFVGCFDILVVHTYFVARNIGTVVVQHGKIC